MQIPRIFHSSQLSVNSIISLDDGARRHAIQVLRLKESAPLTLFDGLGSEFSATISSIEKHSVEVCVVDKHTPLLESPLNIHLFQVISKGERMDYAVQKATEGGVSEITPLFSERCVVKLDTKRVEKKISHWQKIALATCEQCGRNKIPTINPAISFKQMLNNGSTGAKFIFNEKAEHLLSKHPLTQQQLTKILMVIGPEGGLSEKEVKGAQSSGWNEVLLGPRVLRSETAPVVAITTMQLLWGDL